VHATDTAVFEENSSIKLTERKIKRLTVKVGNCLGKNRREKIGLFGKFSPKTPQ
jgi:hypothetical protein